MLELRLPVAVDEELDEDDVLVVDDVVLEVEDDVDTDVEVELDEDDDVELDVEVELEEVEVVCVDVDVLDEVVGGSAYNSVLKLVAPPQFKAKS